MVKVYTTTWCGDCRVVKQALQRATIPFEEINIEHDPAAAEYVLAVNGGRRSVPTLVYNGQAISLSGFTREKFATFVARYKAALADG